MSSTSHEEWSVSVGKINTESTKMKHIYVKQKNEHKNKTCKPSVDETFFHASAPPKTSSSSFNVVYFLRDIYQNAKTSTHTIQLINSFISCNCVLNLLLYACTKHQILCTRSLNKLRLPSLQGCLMTINRLQSNDTLYGRYCPLPTHLPARTRNRVDVITRRK